MKNTYLPDLALITKVIDETPRVKTFHLRFRNTEIQRSFDFVPGQFVQVLVFGHGEAPFSISSPPDQRESIEITVNRVGSVTDALFGVRENDTIGIRGPFGNGFPVMELEGKDFLFISGGCGLAPMRSLIKHILSRRERYGNLIMMYGARTPADILFKREIRRWERDVDIHLTVEMPDETWKGTVGVVTVLFTDTLKPENTVVVSCGPTIMMHFVAKKLLELGFSEDQMYVSLERHMKCGMGMCGHCNIGMKYVCKDGPVFSLRETRGFLERAV